MARPTRCRRICGEPTYHSFIPEGISDREKIILTVDEYEVIRLIDLEKFTHQECSNQMDISRTTVTEIYSIAREKIADSIVNGKPLVISGGNYRLCDGSAIRYCHKHCKKLEGVSIHLTVPKKGANTMRIAVTYEDGKVFQHFGHTQNFKLYDIDEGKIVNEQVVDTNGQGHGALAGFLTDAKVDALICGGIGGGAQAALAEVGIKLFGGVSGNADDAVKAYLEGTLGFNPNVQCSHHGHEHTCGGHHEHDHSCGGHHEHVHSCGQ